MGDFIEEDLKNRAAAVHNAGNSFELLLQLFHEESENLRQYIRRFGERVRNFVQSHLNKKEMYAESLMKLAAKANQIDIEDCVDGRSESRFQTDKTYTIPSRTFVDLAFILLNDEDDGVISRLTAANPKWEKLPEYTPVIPKESDSCGFQLWNRPMGSPCTMPEDDEDRLSLPSTRATDWGQEKMNSVETQLALLTKQMQHLLQLQQQQHSGGEMSKMARHKSPMHVSDSSEDEGRGASLPSLINSPLTGRRNKSQAVSHTIAAVVPPPGPPPPPPPPALLKPIENKSIVTTSKSDKSPVEQRPLRPTAQDLRNVQLRKVVARSPGGTPQQNLRKRSLDNVDNQDNLLSALKNRFRAFNGSMSEHDDPDRDESWADDD